MITQNLVNYRTFAVDYDFWEDHKYVDNDGSIIYNLKQLQLFEGEYNNYWIREKVTFKIPRPSGLSPIKIESYEIIKLAY